MPGTGIPEKNFFSSPANSGTQTFPEMVLGSDTTTSASEVFTTNTGINVSLKNLFFFQMDHLIKCHPCRMNARVP